MKKGGKEGEEEDEIICWRNENVNKVLVGREKKERKNGKTDVKRMEQSGEKFSNESSLLLLHTFWKRNKERSKN